MRFCHRPVLSKFVLLGILAVAFPAKLLLAQSQSVGSSTRMSGVVRWDRGGSMYGLRVELKNTGGWETTTTDVRPDGTFQTLTLGTPAQQYILQVRDRSGEVVYDGVVRPDTAPWEILLHTPERERPVTGVVSVEELLAAPPQKALRKYERAQKAVRRGDVNRAIRHLRAAIRIHPDFVEAHNSLGVKYMMQRHYERAAEAFEEALRLRPDSPEPLSNLGMALHGLGQYEDAERLIRRSLELRPQAARTRYALALVLIAEGGHEQEALEILDEVSGQVPEALLHSAALLDGRADYKAAARKVAAYLDSDEKKHRPTAQQWFASLQSRIQVGKNSID